MKTIDLKTGAVNLKQTSILITSPSLPYAERYLSSVLKNCCSREQTTFLTSLTTVLKTLTLLNRLLLLKKKAGKIKPLL